MRNFLDKIGLGIINVALAAKSGLLIPPDNDDSSVNLALLAYMKSINSSHYEFWNSLNYKKKEFYDLVLKYAYRPFDANETGFKWADEIDPRTYYILRNFLD